LKKEKGKKKQYQSPAMQAFMYGINSPKSQEHYPFILRRFFKHLGLFGNDIDTLADTFIDKAKSNGNAKWIQDGVINYVSYNKKRIESKDLTAGALGHYVTAIKLFCDTNDDLIPDVDTIKWKKIRRGIPKANSNAKDRAPTKEEIRKLLEFPDRRLKPLILVMCSSGIREGAWENLDWKHVEPYRNDKGDVIAAKLTVYAGDAEEYYSFMTPEAFYSLESYMNFRASLGEDIDGNSPLIRDILPESNAKQQHVIGVNYGFATKPVRLGTEGIKKILIRALWAQGLRKPLPKGKRRYEFKLGHGWRKFFETTIDDTEEGMKPMMVAQLMNHRSGMSQHYRRPPVKKVLENYLKVVDSLTIYDDKIILQKQLAKTTPREETESLKKTVTEMAVRQSAIESILKKIIADEQDWNPNDPHENKQIDETFQRIIAPNSDFFGE
jgi:hypothetical protein